GDSNLGNSNLGGSVLAACAGLSPIGLTPSGLPESTLAESLADGSVDAGSSRGGAAFCCSLCLKNSRNASLSLSLAPSSPLGLPRLLSLCLVVSFRPSEPRSPAACAGTWPSESGLAASPGPSAGRASRLALRPRRPLSWAPSPCCTCAASASGFAA